MYVVRVVVCLSSAFCLFLYVIEFFLVCVLVLCAFFFYNNELTAFSFLFLFAVVFLFLCCDDGCAYISGF